MLDCDWSSDVCSSDLGLAWTKISGADRNTTQGSPYRDLDPFVAALRDASIDRLVWGSDWPHINYHDDPSRVPDDGELLNLLARWFPEPRDRLRVLVDNPARLYGFEHREG
jgi:predicted TIM-barrel fold metal-dependent hydrolase